MKQLLILFFLLRALSAAAQCQAININSFNLKALGGCRYVIEVDATLTHGNASIRPFYSCMGVTTELSTCFTWEVPSTKAFVSDTFICCESLLVGLHGYSSANCNGNQCIEIPLSNLALKEVFPAEKTVSKRKDLEYNPITRLLTIKRDNYKELIIYSRDGREVHRERIKSNITVLPQMTNGVYFIVVTTTGDNLIKTITL